MNYYKRHIGDYAKKAGRLSLLQHGVFTLLIDACYDREAFPTRDEAVDWVWASSSTEIEAVDFVLRKFFTQIDGRYVEKGIEEDLRAYKSKAETNSRIAHDRETARKVRGTNRARIVNAPSEIPDEPPPNHKPLTINQEPVTNKQGASVALEEVGPVGPARTDSGPSELEAAAEVMAAAGLSDVSKGNPTLRKLIAEGMTAAELGDAATEAAKRGHGASWALARAEGRRRDAAGSAPLPRAKGAGDPDARAAIEADGVRLGLGKWQQLDRHGHAVTWQSYANQVRAARADEAEGVHR